MRRREARRTAAGALAEALALLDGAAGLAWDARLSEAAGGDLDAARSLVARLLARLRRDAHK